MSVFRKRETPVENIAFLAICAGIDAVLSLVSALLPASALILMLVIPLTSAVASFYCKAKYFPIYLVASAGVCLAVSAWNISNTLFYVIPSLLVGAAYGFGIKNRLTSSFVLFICSVLSFGLFYASMLLVKALLEVDVQDSLLALVGLSDKEGAAIGFPLFIYGYSLAQMAIVHIFLQSEFAHLGNVEINENNVSKWYCLPSFTFLGGAIGCAFISAKAAYLLLGLGIYWALYCLYDIALKKKPLPWIILGILVFVGWLGFAALYSALPAGNGLSILALPLLSIPITHFLNQVLLRKKGNDSTIKP